MFRWIELEEDIEEGSGRWSKPYIPILSYKTLIDFRKSLHDGALLLDIEDSTLDEIANRISELLADNDVISRSYIRAMHATLLARYRHQHQKDTEVSIHQETIPNPDSPNRIHPIKTKE